MNLHPIKGFGITALICCPLVTHTQAILKCFASVKELLQLK